jgi:hypothetical protein
MLRCDLPDTLHGRNARVCNITTAQMPENVLAVACIDTGVLVVFKEEAVWMAASSLQVRSARCPRTHSAFHRYFSVTSFDTKITY